MQSFYEKFFFLHKDSEIEHHVTHNTLFKALVLDDFQIKQGLQAPGRFYIEQNLVTN